MSKKDLLLEDWKECMQHTRLFRDQTNKMYLWELGLLPMVGFGVAIKLFSDGYTLYSGIAFIILSLIMGYADFIFDANVKEFQSIKEVSKQIEKKLGTSLSTRINKEYKKALEKDGKFRRLECKIFHYHIVRWIKYILFFIGVWILLL